MGFYLLGLSETLSVLCLGTHFNDIEIGAGVQSLAGLRPGVQLEAHWCVLSAIGPRAAEAKECRSLERYAEAFVLRKARLG